MKLIVQDWHGGAADHRPGAHAIRRGGLVLYGLNLLHRHRPLLAHVSRKKSDQSDRSITALGIRVRGYGPLDRFPDR